MRKLRSMIFLFLFFCPVFLLAGEITGVAYDLCPYGIYRKLRCKRIATEDSYIQNKAYGWEVADDDKGQIDCYIDSAAEDSISVATVSSVYPTCLPAGSVAKPFIDNWAVASDSRIQKNIWAYTNGLEVIKKINPVWFKYNGKAGFSDDDQEHVGVIAQEISKVAPYTVSIFRAKLNLQDKETTRLLNFNSYFLIFDLINAVKELDRYVTNLNIENQRFMKTAKELKSAIKNLEFRLTYLEAKMASELF